MSNDSDDPEFDKLLAELEKEGEESAPIIVKQIQKAKDEKAQKQFDEYTDVGDDDIPDDETGDAFY